ncbi:helix-turn-helix domain-containing protein [Paenibacillus thiaminolyticus]|uniref:helix-turn-helix domain-containing protein n=1 Tax=Paenibacillus thiaminolyticus TaxID=49283 RepID=UPI003D282D7C
MTKGRSTTWQERIDIVQYCLAHQYDYRKTADHFQVSYQQVYQWVKKFEEGGQDALKDGRGRTKAPEELTSISPMYSGVPIVFQTLKRALQEAPGSKPMLHSDRAFQYTSLFTHLPYL